MKNIFLDYYVLNLFIIYYHLRNYGDNIKIFTIPLNHRGFDD